MVNRSIRLLPLLIALILGACITPNTMKPTKSAGLVEKFYKGDGQMLYFIKDVGYKSEDKKLQLHIDYTLDYDKKEDRPFKANFSVFSDEPIKEIKSVSFPGLYETVTVEKMFIEKKKKAWTNRYSFSIPFATFKKIVEQKTPQIAFKTPTETITFNASKKWPKQAAIINELVLLQIELNE